MTGLVIKLKPNEKVLVNGVVLQNGDKAARIRVRSSDVSILRARDAMLKEDADTPLKRVYYIAQLAMAGEADPHLASEQILEGLKPLKSIFFGEAGEDIITKPEWDDPAIGRFARVHDPEGNPIELWQPPKR